MQPSVVDLRAGERKAPAPPPRAPRSGLIRYLRVYGALVRNSVVREMSFKANFILWLFVELLWFGLQLGFNSVVYLHTDRIGDWTKWEVMMLIGASHFIQQLFQAFFLLNCAQLSELVHTGKLDFMLLLPVNTRFLLSFRQVELGGFINAGSGLVVMAYAAQELGVYPSTVQWLGFGLLCLAAILVHYSLMFVMATASFWTVRAQGLVMAYYNLFSVARLPDAAFRGTFHVVFTLAVPMLIVVNVPVKVLIDKLSAPAEVVVMLAMCAVCFLLSKLVWIRAMQRYTSASS
jgi:ABC-2 type transport system permease protein